MLLFGVCFELFPLMWGIRCPFQLCQDREDNGTIGWKTPGAENGNEGDDGEYIENPEQGIRKGLCARGAMSTLTSFFLQKEVERRRRGNINELRPIVPSGSGEKAKGVILSRVQCTHHLKGGGARNIEKWTLEKLLMDQAMADLQVQLDGIRRMWEEERRQRQRAKQELEAARRRRAVRRSAASPAGREEGDGKR
ncbi:hypothetical protein DFH08DRAFT_934215 [Mycena albidolilacea]|uniref:Uncharacterized protein n=1 Tax=Mycena albidolilacea TaxID=1033008 RepID=A0AAD7AA50_9AGAR|nr:hypothetical protein DFH08DRAFT_934215 [Mycena albidolilacea]